MDAVANIADDDILNHAPFEDSDDEDSVAGSCAQLSPRVMRLEYMASLNCVVAMTPRRGLTVHHLGLIDPHGRAPIERMRSGRISGTSGAVAFALDASKTHPTCVAVSRAGRKKPVKNIQFFDVSRATSGNRTHDAPDASNRAPSQFPPWSQASRPRAWASRTRRCDSRGTARSTHSHVGTDRWFCAVNTKTGAARDVVPLVNHPGYEESLGLTHVEMLPIVEEDGTRVTVCVTGGAGAVLSPAGTPAGKALQFCNSSSGPIEDLFDTRWRSRGRTWWLWTWTASCPAAVFDRAKPGGEPWEGEPVQFIDTFAGGTEADRSEQSAIAVRFF